MVIFRVKGSLERSTQRLLLLLGLAPLLLALVACGRSKSTASAAQDGAKLFASYCADCHGKAGDRIPAVPLQSADFLGSRGDATLLAVVAQGKGTMEGFGQGRGGPLTDDQVREVVAFLDSQAGRSSSTQLATAGQKIYALQCGRCHGDNGDRVPIAPLNNKGFLDTKTNDDMRQVITEGKGLMPAWGKAHGGPLSDNDIAAVISFLRYRGEAQVAQNAASGQALYASQCLVCHGPRGDKVTTVNLGSAADLTRLGDGSIIAAMTAGKGAMPALGSANGGPLAVTDVASILTYMKASSGLSATAALTTQATKGTGGVLYAQNCAKCHGGDGLAVAGVPLLYTEFQEHLGDQVIQQTITSGTAGGMPAWGQQAGGPLSGDQIASVIDFLKANAAAQPIFIVPEMVTLGKDVYTQTCAACHGEKRDKIPEANLSDPTWLTSIGFTGLRQGIATGKAPKMPIGAKAQGGQLDDGQIANVAAYLWDAAALDKGSPAQGPATSSSAGTPSSGTAAAQGISTGLPQAITADVAIGKTIYSQNCAICHGDSRDKVATARINDPAWLKATGIAGVESIITNGRPPIMPTWGKSKGGPLSDDQIASVAAFLWDAAGLSPSDAATAPAGASQSAADVGNAPTATTSPFDTVLKSAHTTPTGFQRGQVIFTGICAMCHGPDGMAKATVPLGSKAWLGNHSQEGLIARITAGKPAAGMPAWGQGFGGPLSNDDIASVIAYLFKMAH